MVGYLDTVPQLSDRAIAHTHQPMKAQARRAWVTERRRYRRELTNLLRLIRVARALHEAQHGPLPASQWAHVT